MVPFSPSSGSLACREATRSPDGFSSSTCSTVQGAAEWHRAPFRLPPQTPEHGRYRICTFLYQPCTSPKAQTPRQDPQAVPEAGQHGEVRSKAGKGSFCLASRPPILPCLTTSLAALGHAAAVSCMVMGGGYVTHVTPKASTTRKIEGSVTVLVLSALNRLLQLQMQGVSTHRFRGQSPWQWKAISSVPTSQPREACDLWKCSWLFFLGSDT